VFALLVPPFGLRAYLQARAIDGVAANRATISYARPVAAAEVQAPITSRRFVQPSVRPVLDGVSGKGAWFLIFNGDWTDPDADRAQALVDSAMRADLSHIYVRVADSRRHFYAGPALQDLLPMAHARGLAVIGWIEPELNDPISDAEDAIATAHFHQGAQRLDGLALTIEGITHDPNVTQYLSGIRAGVPGVKGLGDRYLLVASTLANPSYHPNYAYATMSRFCQVFAPMAYWRATGLRKYTGPDGVRAFLSQVFQEFSGPGVNPFKRPISITAQAYDAADEYGVPGSPPVSEIVASMDEARAQGGLSWSYYRLADADNGVTADESAAITSYPHWQRNVGPAIASKPLIPLPDLPVAY
jgi:hypothetical protein